MINVFISILTYNDNKSTLECLDSLEDLEKDKIDLNVVVVDNASIEKFTSKKDYKNFNLTILSNEENLGFSGGHNIGIKYAIQKKADYVVILNNDVIVEKNLIKNLLQAFSDRIGIVSPKIYFAKGHEFHEKRYKEFEKGNVIWYAGAKMDWDNIIGKHVGVDEVDNGQYDKQKETELATGCCMMVKKEVFEKIGLLDNKYFLYYEDADFSIKAKKSDFRILFEPENVLWHKNAASTGGSGSELQDYYISRNRMLFGSRYASFRVKLALFRESIKIIKSGRPWQKIGIRDFYLRKFDKGSYSK